MMGESHLTPLSGDYYSKENNFLFLSVSQFKGFLECEAREVAKISGEYEEPDRRAFLIGKYVHANFESFEAYEQLVQDHREDLYKLRALNKDDVIQNYVDALKWYAGTAEEKGLVYTAIEKAILKTSFDRAKEIGKIEKSLNADGMESDEIEVVVSHLKKNWDNLHRKHGEKYADVQKADKMIRKLKSDELAMKHLNGEKELEFTGELFGYEWKIKVDNFNPFEGFFSDLKTTADIYGRHYSPRHGKYVSFIDRYGYDLQAAVYQQIIFQNTGELMDPYIVAVSKEDIPNIEVIAIDPERMEDALEYIEEQIDRVVSVKNGETAPTRCERCDYCKETKKLERVLSVEDLLGN